MSDAARCACCEELACSFCTSTHLRPFKLKDIARLWKEDQTAVRKLYEWERDHTLDIISDWKLYCEACRERLAAITESEKPKKMQPPSSPVYTPSSPCYSPSSPVYTPSTPPLADVKFKLDSDEETTEEEEKSPVKEKKSDKAPTLIVIKRKRDHNKAQDKHEPPVKKKKTAGTRRKHQKL
jgi:hypothetical protein